MNVQLNGIAFGTPGGSGTLFVAIGGNRVLMTSPDGITGTRVRCPGKCHQPERGHLERHAVRGGGRRWQRPVAFHHDLAGRRQLDEADGSSEILYGLGGVGSGGTPTLTVAVTSANSADQTGTPSSPRRTASPGPGGACLAAGRCLALAARGWLRPRWLRRRRRPGQRLHVARRHHTLDEPHAGGLASAQRRRFGSGVFCAAGINGSIHRSTDGVVWTQASNPPDPLTPLAVDLGRLRERQVPDRGTQPLDRLLARLRQLDARLPGDPDPGGRSRHRCLQRPRLWFDRRQRRAGGRRPAQHTPA